MTTRQKYAISAWWWGRRYVIVRPMEHATALRIGRHLWRLRWLGFRHVQVEAEAERYSSTRTNYALWSEGR